MPPEAPSCVICEGTRGDPDRGRVQVWEDDHRRLTVAKEAEVAGFSYLEPKRPVAHITDLDGPEAATLGSVLARVTRALREGAEAWLTASWIWRVGGQAARELQYEDWNGTQGAQNGKAKGGWRSTP